MNTNTINDVEYTPVAEAQQQVRGNRFGGGYGTVSNSPRRRRG